MNENDAIRIFDWERIFYSHSIQPAYMLEIALRTVIMFMILIIALKFLSKRGVKQLSVFELAILIALGSATGDPMFYSYLPLAYGAVVLVVVILLYRVITKFTANSKLLESLLEGKPLCLVADGKIHYENYKKIGLPYDKFFAELRIRSIDHLGQVRKVYLETSGEFSVYMLKDTDVKPGLPIYPELIKNPLKNPIEGQTYACIYCGNIQHIQTGNNKCLVCGNEKWLLPLADKRVV